MQDNVQLQVVRLLNPFDPRERVLESLQWEPNKTLADYYPVTVVHAQEYVVSVSGRIVMPEEFDKTYLTKEDNLILCPVPLGGGGGGKNILRMVAMIAIAVVAPYAAAALNTSMGLGLAAGSFGMSMLTAGITMVGGMLVNALLPQKPVQKPAMVRDDIGSSPTYGVDGAKNTASEGLPVPVCYGKFRMAGNLINFYVDNIGSTQVIYMLFNAGEGPVGNLTDFQINDQPITNFSNYEIETRVGGDAQSPIPWFADTVEPHNVGQTLAHDSWVNYTTSQDIDKFRVDVVAPGGLYGVDTTSGATYGYGVDLIIEYRKVGDPSWTQLANTNGIVGYQTVEVCETITEYQDDGSD